MTFLRAGNTALLRSLLSGLLLLGSVGAFAQPRAIIFDTDFGGDADDLGALFMLHHLVDSGDCELLGVMNWTTEVHAGAAIVAINETFERPVPVGSRPGDYWSGDWHYSKAVLDALGGAPGPLALPDTTELYRQLLAAQPDRAVDVVTVGPLSNILRLLQSGPDDHSLLTGRELVAAKVRRFVVMGGQFPEGEQEWNFWGDMPGVTAAVLEALPVPVVFSGYEVGEAIRTGPELAGLASSHPLHAGYLHFSANAPWMKERFQGDILDNASFDQTAVLFAVFGQEGLPWRLSQPGRVVPDDRGGNQWRFEADGPHRYLVLEGQPEQIAGEISRLMIGPEVDLPITD